MNILQIGELYKSGGASEIMQILDEGLKEENHFVLNIYVVGEKNNSDTDIIFYNNSSFFRRRHKFLSHLSNIMTRIFILNIIKKYKIDLIQMHAMQNSFLTLKDIVWLSKRIKIVWTLHDTWVFTGGCIAFMQCNKWKTDNCKNCELSSVFISSINKNSETNYLTKSNNLSKTNCFFVSPSEWNKDNFYNSYLSNKKIRVINNGIKGKFFFPLSNRELLRKEHNLSKKVLMFMAAITSLPWKGWDLLYDAILQLEHPEEFELIIVGHVDKNIDELPMHIIKTGYIQDKNELNKYYNMADLFIIPSRQDNFPTVVIESMFVGTPVLGFKTGGIPELLENDRGWLAEDMTAESLKNKIEEIFAPGYEERLSKQRQKVAEESHRLYTQDVMVRKYIELYDEILYKHKDII